MRRTRYLAFPALFASLAWSQQPRTVVVPDPVTVDDYKSRDASREPYQNATGLLAELDVKPGDWVADVGAGTGYYSMRLAALVGESGKVFSEDIAVGAATARARIFDLRNVEVVKGEVDDPKLPADRLSAILIVDTYHHFTDYPAMLEKMLHSLKPGGRLAIADYSIAAHRNQSRAEQLKTHEIDPALVRAEVEKAGFRMVRLAVPFVPWHAGPGNTRSTDTDFWLLVAVRP